MGRVWNEWVESYQFAEMFWNFLNEFHPARPPKTEAAVRLSIFGLISAGVSLGR